MALLTITPPEFMPGPARRLADVGATRPPKFRGGYSPIFRENLGQKMSNPHRFRVPRLPDDQVVALMAKAFEEAGFTDVRVSMRTIVQSNIQGQIAKLSSEAQAKRILSAQSQLVRDFSFEHSMGSVQLTRTDGQLSDEVGFHFTPQAGEAADRLLMLAKGIKDHLKELRSEDALSLLGPQLQHHYETREAELSRLEAAIARGATQFADHVAATRKTLENEFAERRKQLEDAARQQSERDKQVAEQRAKALDDRDEALKKRVADIDDRDSRHVRRQIRADMKGEIKARADKFELTEGTRQLRRPVQWFCWVLLAVFGLGFLFYSVEGAVLILQAVEQGAASKVDPWLAAFRLAVFGAAFGSTAVFYIRWSNRWFEQHASEEFQLKRLALDLDRASWVVEMAMEWKDEKGKEIAPHLLDRLTANLFAPTKPEHEALHPADQLASVLLGSASEATIKAPGGSEVKIDRKGLRNLGKQGGEAEG